MNNTLPPQILEMLKSKKLSDGVQKIGDLFGLHIDQVGELYAEISDILMGTSKSSDFIKHIAERLEIDEETANKIAESANIEIFQAVKNAYQSPDVEKLIKPTHITDLEKAGDFTIENEIGPMIKNNIPSSPIRFSNPNISTEKPVNMPAEEVVNTPVEMMQNETPVPIKTPVQESIVTPIPDTAAVPVPPILTETIVPATNPIPTSMSEANNDSSSSEIAPVLKPEQKIEVVPEPVPEVHKEPLADQLLGALNKSHPKTTAPTNLPISGEEVTTTTKDKPKSSDMYREPLG